MSLRSMIAVAALGVAVAVPVRADPKDPFAEFDARLEQLLAPEAWLKGRVTEADVQLLFAYLKASLVAAAEGRELPVPPELSQRAEAIGRELELQGVLTGLRLLDALESAAKQAVREALAGPPASR